MSETNITEEEILKLNESMPPAFYLDMNDPEGLGYYYEDNLIGRPKSLGELIYLAYKFGFDECKENQLKILNQQSIDIKQIISNLKNPVGLN